MLGYSQQELVGQNVKILMPQPYRDEHDQFLSRFLANRKPRIIGIGREVNALHKDGTIIPVDLAVSQIEHLELFVGILRDISYRKHLETQVLEIASAEQRRIGLELHDGTGPGTDRFVPVCRYRK